MSFQQLSIAILVLFLSCCREISAHGRLNDPPNRSGVWRHSTRAVINYSDNELFCGGWFVQYELNGGKCGVCGDNYAQPRPRPNENTGTYGRGIIVNAPYKSGSIINVTAELTANHLGTFTYSLCEIKDSSKPEDEECFKKLRFADGSEEFKVHKLDFFVTNQLQLPEGLTCEQCVLRWHYKTGNSWGVCEDGTQGMGCGDQETFRSCSDIRIV